MRNSKGPGIGDNGDRASEEKVAVVYVPDFAAWSFVRIGQVGLTIEVAAVKEIVEVILGNAEQIMGKAIR